MVEGGNQGGKRHRCDEGMAREVTAVWTAVAGGSGEEAGWK